MELRKNLILRSPRSGRLEGRTAPIPAVDSRFALDGETPANGIFRSHGEGPIMLSLRTHAVISAGILAAMIALAMIGNALEASGVVLDNPGVRLTAMIVFFGLSAALVFSVVPVMVKLVLGFQAGIGNAGHPAVAGLIAHERIIVFVLWGLIALGLVVAVPAAIIDGAFD